MTAVADKPQAEPVAASGGGGAGGVDGRLIVSGIVVALVGGFFYVHTSVHLWLDEALSVNIARLPLSQLQNALKHDGAPPLYYLLLHGWTSVFGTGDTAVRSLSSVCMAAALVTLWFVARRWLGSGV